MSDVETEIETRSMRGLEWIRLDPLIDAEKKNDDCAILYNDLECACFT